MWSLVGVCIGMNQTKLEPDLWFGLVHKTTYINPVQSGLKLVQNQWTSLLYEPKLLKIWVGDKQRNPRSSYGGSNGSNDAELMENNGDCVYN